jgi:hypothetical protein
MLKVNRRFGSSSCYLLHANFVLGLFLGSSETSVDVQQTTRRYIPEDRTLHKSTAVSKSNPTSLVFSFTYDIPSTQLSFVFL